VKLSIAIVLLTLLFLGLGWYSETLIARQAESILSELENLATCLQEGKTAEIDRQLARINQLWLSARRFWVLLTDHHDLDDFELYLARTKSYLANKAYILALSGIAEMKQTIHRIPDQLRLNLENIF